MSALKVLFPICLLIGFVLVILPPPVPAADLPKRSEISNLLVEKNYRRLEMLLAEYQMAYERDPRNEEVVEQAYAAFETSDPKMEKRLDVWVEAMSGSPAAHLARGAYFYHLGWLSRGKKYIRKTDPAQIGGMQDNFAKATKDISAAVRMNPRFSVGYAYLIGMGMADGADAENERLLVAALGSNPYSYSVRRRYLFSLIPKWGGSFEAMQRFVNESNRISERNPKIKLLPGYIPYAHGDEARLAGDFTLAERKYTEALSYGESAFLLTERGKNYYRMRMYDRALVDFSKALVLQPHYVAALAERGNTYYKMKGHDAAALSDLDLAIQLDPLVSDQLITRAKILWRLKRYDEAEKDYENALVYGEYSAFTWRSKGRFYLKVRKNYRQAASDFARAVELDPDYSGSWYHLGVAYYFLGDQRAVTALERYLGLCETKTDCKDKEMVWAQSFVDCSRRTVVCAEKREGQQVPGPGNPRVDSDG